MTQEQKKRPVGRPTKYTPDLPEKLIEFFDVENERTVFEEVITNKGEVVQIAKVKGNFLPTVEGFCRHLKIAKSTFYKWIDENKEFSDALEIAKPIQQDILIQNSLQANYQSGIGKMMLTNLTDYQDKKTVEQSGEIKVELPSGQLAKL